MILAFTLSMPGRNSWDGRWSGEDKPFILIRNFAGKNGEAQAHRILSEGYYHYSFGDGWAAGVDVKQVDSRESQRLRRKSAGFAGYDWMVDSIVDYGKILNSVQVRKLVEQQAAEKATANAGSGI